MRLRSRGSMVVALVAVGAVAVTGSVAVAGRRSAPPDLPRITPSRLIASIARAAASDPSISGDLTLSVDLGLPSLPAEGPAAAGVGASTIFQALSGRHRVRLWRSKDGIRLAELLPLAELGFFASPTDVWAWNSKTVTAYHVASSPAGMGGGEAYDPGMGMADPLELTRRSLATISPTTRVSMGTPVRVAGHEAYLLRIEPRTAKTLVGRIEIAVDAARRVPLRVAVFARGAADAAVSLGFDWLSFGPIDAATYRFSPPPGSHVVTPRKEVPHSHAASGVDEYGGPVRVFGSDWATVVATLVPKDALRTGAGEGFDLQSFLPYSGPLLSVRLVRRDDHAWLIYGAVPQQALAEVEPELR